MTFDSWSAIDSGDSVIRNRKITTVVLGEAPVAKRGYERTTWAPFGLRLHFRQT